LSQSWLESNLDKWISELIHPSQKIYLLFNNTWGERLWIMTRRFFFRGYQNRWVVRCGYRGCLRIWCVAYRIC
jgi:hypothetical protein